MAYGKGTICQASPPFFAHLVWFFRKHPRLALFVKSLYSKGMNPPRINRSHVLWIAAVIIVSMTLFPPFEFCATQGVTLAQGYAFILTPPKFSLSYTEYNAMVNTTLLLTQVVIVLIVAGLAYFAIPERKQAP